MVFLSIRSLWVKVSLHILMDENKPVFMENIELDNRVLSLLGAFIGFLGVSLF